MMDYQSNKAFTLYRPDHCPICNNDRVLELYDWYNHPVRFTTMVDMNDYSKLHEKRLHHLRCKICKTEFELDWMIDKDIPYPLNNDYKKEIINNKLLSV